MTSYENKLIAVVKRLQKDPVLFIEEILGCLTLEKYQKKIAQAIEAHSKVAVRACHSVGKTFLMGRLALWFLYSHKPSIVITTAPTYRQVVKLLWGEIRKAWKASKTELGGQANLNEIKIDEDWYAMGFSPQEKAGEGKEQKSSTFQGFHSRYVMIIFDEACGISADVFKMAYGLISSGAIVKWVCIGNPTTRGSEFFKLFTKADWKGIKISCLDSPNMEANGLSSLEGIEEELNYLRRLTDDERLSRIEGYKKPSLDLLTAQWAMSCIYDWGLDHPLTLSKVMAEFPLTDDNVIIQYESIQKAIDREVPLVAGETRYIGVDVARYGTDNSVFTEIIGYKQTRKKTLSKLGNTELSGELLNFANDMYWQFDTVIIVDGTGVGSGVVDISLENKKNNLFKGKVKIIEVHFGQSIELDDKEKEREERKVYHDLKAKMFYLLNQDLRDNLELLRDEIYEGQLPTVRFSINSKGKIVIESKDEYKARTGLKSPDEADSLALSNLGRYLAQNVGQFKPTGAEKPLRERLEENKAREKQARKPVKKMKIREY